VNRLFLTREDILVCTAFDVDDGKAPVTRVDLCDGEELMVFRH